MNVGLYIRTCTVPYLVLPSFLKKKGGSCEVVLAKVDVTPALSMCPYKQLIPKIMYHKTLMGHYYFYFNEPHYVSVVFPNGSVYQEVSSHFPVLTVCSLNSKISMSFLETFTRVLCLT